MGEPGGEEFQAAIHKLYSVAYTLKFALKKAAVLDFKVPNLECLWYGDLGRTPPTEWRWRLLVRLPDQVSAQHVAETRAEMTAKKELDASSVARLTWEEGRTVQMLHVGPYEGLTETYQRLWAFAHESGLVPMGPAHEVYLSDPNRTAPERLKTIVRLPVGAG